jgi:hypothetical protein
MLFFYNRFYELFNYFGLSSGDNVWLVFLFTSFLRLIGDFFE